MNRALGTCVPILKGLTFMSLRSLREKGKISRKKKFKKKNVKLSKFGKKHKFTE